MIDDKTFVATYVAQESERINQRLKKMLAGEESTAEERASVVDDIETTLKRLQSALSFLQTEVEREQAQDEDVEEGWELEAI